MPRQWPAPPNQPTLPRSAPTGSTPIAIPRPSPTNGSQLNRRTVARGPARAVSRMAAASCSASMARGKPVENSGHGCSAGLTHLEAGRHFQPHFVLSTVSAGSRAVEGLRALTGTAAQASRMDAAAGSPRALARCTARISKRVASAGWGGPLSRSCGGGCAPCERPLDHESLPLPPQRPRFTASFHCQNVGERSPEGRPRSSSRQQGRHLAHQSAASPRQESVCPVQAGLAKSSLSRAGAPATLRCWPQTGSRLHTAGAAAATPSRCHRRCWPCGSESGRDSKVFSQPQTRGKFRPSSSRGEFIGRSCPQTLAGGSAGAAGAQG